MGNDTEPLFLQIDLEEQRLSIVTHPPPPVS